MRASRFSILPLAASLLLFFGCTETPTGPGVGSGTLLEASVNGTDLSLDVNDVFGFNTYTLGTKEVRLGGTLVGTPSKTITLRFNYDIDAGPFPKTLSGDAISINYIENTGATPLTYDCPIGANSCSITVTASDGHTVDGTFTASLSESNDSTKKVTITDGKFSVKLTRQ